MPVVASVSGGWSGCPGRPLIRYLSFIAASFAVLFGASSRGCDRQGDATQAFAVAGVCVAGDARGLHTVERARCEAGPHAAVDLGHTGTLAHQRAQRARCRLDHCDTVTDLRNGRMEAELSEARADAFRAGRKPLRRHQPDSPKQLVGERDPDRAQPLPTELPRRCIDEEAEQLLVTAV